MINFEPEVYTYIKKNVTTQDDAVPCVYALVQETEDSNDIPILFNLMPDAKMGEAGEWVLESPCSLVIYGKAPTREEFLKSAKEEDEWEDWYDSTPEEYYDDIIAPMVLEGIWYDIDVPQTGPFLPDEVAGLKFVTEHEMLLWLIEHYTGQYPQDVVDDVS